MRKFFWLACIIFLAACGGGGDGGGGSADNTSASGNTFYAVDFNDPALPTYPLQATKAAEGVHCQVYVENGRTVSDADLQNLVATFDTSVYPNVVSHFGNVPNIDGDPKIYILLMDIQGEDNNAQGIVTSYVAGYFYAWNEYPTLPDSNGKEIFFMDIVEGNPSGPQFYNTLAHEFQHMIHWNVKPDDDTWLDEAMSEIAPFYAGLGVSWSRVSGFEQGSNRSDSLVLWQNQIEDYYVAYMWAQYIADRFPENVFRNILANDNVGIQSVERYLLDTQPSGTTFSTVFRDWSIAVFSGWNAGLTDNGALAYRSIDTWPGTHEGITLPGLLTADHRGRTTLPPLALWSMDLYWYNTTTSSLTWNNDPSPLLQASFYDLSAGGGLTYDAVSGTTYTYDNAAVLILQNANGSTASGSSVTAAAFLSPSPGFSVAPAAVSSPMEKLRAVSASRAAMDLHAATGQPTAVCVDDLLSMRTREALRMLREGGNAP